jgi:presqualene diphosphate synthase
MAIETASENAEDMAKKAIEKIVKGSRTSFHAGMIILPKEQRHAMYTLYAFCRIVDDIADEEAVAETRQRDLALWQHKIRQVFKGEASDPITGLLLPLITRYDLQEQDFQDIIDGMAMDAAGPIVAPTLTTLDLYCDRVASAVGRATMRIVGDDSDHGMRLAYHLGRAFQLTNILRDIAEDTARGRLYLPQELLQKHGISFGDVSDVVGHPALPSLARDLAETARHHYSEATKAMSLCNPKATRAPRMMRAYYEAIFHELCRRDWQNPTVRVNLSGYQKIFLMLKGLCG